MLYRLFFFIAVVIIIFKELTYFKTHLFKSSKPSKIFPYFNLPL